MPEFVKNAAQPWSSGGASHWTERERRKRPSVNELRKGDEEVDLRQKKHLARQDKVCSYDYFLILAIISAAIVFF